MTIDEAIKILDRLVEYYRAGYRGDDRTALKLGIEALKRIKYRRDQGKGYEPRLLPDETED